MMDVVIQNLPVAAIEESPSNPNVMPPGEFDMLCRAIKEKGMLQPVLVRQLSPTEYRVIDGHHRLRAVRACGMTMVASMTMECTDAEEHILRLAMNRLRGEVDLTTAASIFKELNESGVPMSEMLLTGFSEAEMRDLIGAVTQNLDADVKMAISPDDYDSPDVTPPEKETPKAVLEVVFKDMATLKRVKKELMEASGEAADIGIGLLRLLGDEEAE